MPFDFTLNALACFDAVATEGSFQAAAAKLNRTHPTVYAAVKGLERQLGIALLNRRGYRVSLTDEGRAFHERARGLLADAHLLRGYAGRIAQGEESELDIVIGDLCRVEPLLALLQKFFKSVPRTRMHLHFEAISGPWERLLNKRADLIFHHIDKADQRFEYVDLHPVRLIPVVAPNLLESKRRRSLTPRAMREYTQVIIRDTAREMPSKDYYLLEGARSCTVGDQLMKKALILSGMGWGHMPDFLVERELRAGKLRSISGRHFKGGAVEIVAARLRGEARGKIADRLWKFIGQHATEFGR